MDLLILIFGVIGVIYGIVSNVNITREGWWK